MAQQRSLEEVPRLRFQFYRPDYRISVVDREALTRDGDNDERAHARASFLLLQGVIAAAFPTGMDRRDGRMWAAWLKPMLEDQTEAEVTREQLLWLSRHVCNEALRLSPALASWRESCVDYVKELLTVVEST